jgi:hypothetical protein
MLSGTIVAKTWGMRDSVPQTTAITPAADPQVYWHRELPPADGEIMGEYVLEATSDRVPGSLAHRDELWDRCYEVLLANTRERFNQEIRRLGGDFAHVLDESIRSRHDDVAGEAWLHGRFTYVLYRRGQP